MKIVFVIAEADPFIKTGGLGEIGGSLPAFLHKQGDSPNCTGACGWIAAVKEDIIIDLKPAADYPGPVYNPRGCLRAWLQHP